MNNQHTLTGKIIVKAGITNRSPLLVSSGFADDQDVEVILDGHKRPFIPASGFAGMLRDSFSHIEGIDKDPLGEQFIYFWGSKGAKEDKENRPDKLESQSHIIIDDLKVVGDYKIVTRDGVAISSKTGTAIPNHKYDYELLEPQTTFNLNMEITLRDGFEKLTFLRFLDFIFTKGRGGIHHRQGSFKSAGFGDLEWSKVQVFDFPFGSKEKADRWFSYLNEEDSSASIIYSSEQGWSNELSVASFKLTAMNRLTITGVFEIKSSLIIATDDIPDKEVVEKAPDKTHSKDSNGESLITGKSLKGPIRHRALKIINTIRQDESGTGFINELFGYVDENTKMAKSSRVRSGETIIKNADAIQKQPRIKIDRFTGGTIDHALMQVQPLWHKDESISLVFEIEECPRAEAALMLLVMKDLVTQDLPLGGLKSIGKGILKGKNVEVAGMVKDYGQVEIGFNEKGFQSGKAEYIDVLNKWVAEI